MPQTIPAQPPPMSGFEKVEAEETSFADLFRAISNGKWFILICTVICAAASAAYISVTKPVYEATGTVRIDPSRSGSLGLTDALMGGENNVIPTEIGILTSDQVALSTLETLSPEQFQQFAGFPKSQMLFSVEDPQHQPVRLTPGQIGAINQFKLAIGAKQVEGTQLVGVAFRDHNPELAALLLNRAVDAYMRINFQSKYNSVAQVHDWLASQMEDLKKHASDAQNKIAQFQQNNNIIGTDPANNTEIDRLKELNDQVTRAEGDRILKEAAWRAAQSGDPSVLASLVPDANLQSLQGTESSLYAQYVQLSTKFGDNYTPLAEVKTQLSEVRKKISNDVQVITAHLDEDFNASKQAENMLRSTYEQELSRAYALNRKQADYAVLLAEAESSRDLYDLLEFKLQQATVNAGLDSINTIIVDRARTPLVPVAPKKTLILASGLILGCAVGIGAALLKEAMGGEIQTISQLESNTGLVTLTTVPHIEGLKTDTAGGLQRLVTLSEPRGRFAEAYRTLRNSIMLSSIDQPPHLILITSSLPSEGKTLTSVNYAIALAQKSGRVLLVDADLRRPRLHVDFRLSNVNGLGDWLIDRAGPESIVTPISELPNLHFIPAGKGVTFPSEALSSTKLQVLLEKWKSEYDTVLVDSAPILAVSDSLPLARLADATILVARAGVTPLKALKRTRSILVRAHARILGVVLNDSSVGQDTGYYGKNSYGYYE
jgi:succinoglycan biosynthesis transport protein ExoP